MNKQKLLFRGLCLSALLFCCGRTVAQDNSPLPLPPSEAVRQTEAGLSQVLQWIAPDELDLYGFRKTDDFSAIRVGTPLYQLEFSRPDGEHRELRATTILLPLVLQGSVRCFAYLSEENGRWQLSGIGGRNEARNWQPHILSAGREGLDHLDLLHLSNSSRDFLLNRTATAAYREVTPGKESATALPDLGTLYELAVQEAAQARSSSDPSTN